MIVVAGDRDVESIKELWKLCFTTEEEYLDNFFNNCFPYSITLVSKLGDICISSATLIPSEIFIEAGNCNSIFTGFYLYGVCTHPDQRGKGISTSIIKECLDYSRSAGKEYIAVFPASENLYDYYSSFGFINLYCSVHKKRVIRDLEKSNESNSAIFLSKELAPFIERDILLKGGTYNSKEGVIVEYALPSFENSDTIEIYTVLKDSSILIDQIQASKKSYISYLNKSDRDSKQKRGMLLPLSNKDLSPLLNSFMFYIAE